MLAVESIVVESPDLQPIGEHLAAMTGIFPSRAPTDIELRGAQNYAARIRRRIARFLDSEEVETLKWQRPPSQESLWEKVATPVDPAEFLAWSKESDIDPSTGILWPSVVQAARDYIKARWPIYPDTSLGLHTHELALDEYLDVWHLVRTLNDPETIFDDLDSLILLPEQVEAVKAVYPGIYQSIQALALAQLKPFIEIEGAVEKRKTLMGERESQLRLLLGVADEDSFEVEKKPEQKQQPQNKGAATRPEEPTPSEAVAMQRTGMK